MKRLSARDIAELGLLSALLLASQIALRSLPNIELVSLLVIVYTRFLKKRALWVIYVFVLFEGLVYGFGLWWVAYLYVWTILWLVSSALDGVDSPLAWAAVSGVFGLLFGALCSIPYFITGGLAAGFAYFVAGIVFDLIHCAGNFVLALLLWRPLTELFDRYYAKKRR